MDATISKAARARMFRDRLKDAMARAGMTRSGLARAVGADRSTISQILGGEGDRLPGAHLAADCAGALGISADWLLGLTDRPERPGDVLAAAVRMTEAARAPSDQQLFEWHQEAAGAKIRHVPAAMPDLLKTAEVMRWEYIESLGKTPDQAIGAMRDRIDWMQDGGSDYEIAMPLHELDVFARGVGYYRGLDAGARDAQLARMAATCAALYPSLRLFLFDARRVFSAPITVFGRRIAVIYLGQHYLAFRESGRVGLMARHFDWLVREAAIDARDVAPHLESLRDVVD